MPVAPAVAKIMLLLLFAIYKDATPMHVQAFYAPAPVEQFTQDDCEAFGKAAAADWKQSDEDIDAVLASCQPIDDPRDLLRNYREQKNGGPELPPGHPKVEEYSTPPAAARKPEGVHIPGKDEA